MLQQRSALLKDPLPLERKKTQISHYRTIFNIHREFLDSKVFPATLKSVLEQALRMVNYIKPNLKKLALLKKL